MYKFYNLAERNYMSKEEWNDNGNGNFAMVHFRIDTIGFDCARGTFSNDAVRPQWYDEASEIIRDFGIVESCGYKQNNEYLYAHPQDISGIVEKSKIKDIAEIINRSKTMKIRWVDVYDEYVYMPDGEYMEILNSKREDIAHFIVEKSFTNRTHLFHYTDSIKKVVAEKFKTRRINSIEDYNSPKMTYEFVEKIINQLVDKGYLIQSSEYYIRSLNKTEQRKNKVNYNAECYGIKEV